MYIMQQNSLAFILSRFLTVYFPEYWPVGNECWWESAMWFEYLMCTLEDRVPKSCGSLFLYVWKRIWRELISLGLWPMWWSLSMLVVSEDERQLHFFKCLSTTITFLFHLPFVQLCFLEFCRAVTEPEPTCWNTIHTANYAGKSQSNMYALQLIFFWW